MIPLILIIGKFNTGKSNFFNILNYFNYSLSNDFKPLTLNNNLFFNILKNFNYLIVDTLGFNFFYNFNFNFKFFIYDSDIILFFFDIYLGILYEDKMISIFLKKNKKYVFLFINKIDFLNLNINIFNFFKLGFKRPYLINSLSNFNIITSIHSIINIFCFLKNCFYFKKKINKFKIFILNLNYIENKKFLNLFFNKKNIFFNDKNIIFNNFKFLKTVFLILNFFCNYCTKFFLNKISKISFLKFLKFIIISDLIFFFIDPFKFFKNLILLSFILKNFKSLIFLIDSKYLNISIKIYFKNFFIKKFYLFFFYVFFVQIFKLNFYYFLYYIYRIFFFNNFSFNSKLSKKFIFNFNKFLFFNIKKKRVKIFKLIQKGLNPFSIIILGHNLKGLSLKNIFFLKKSFMIFFKIKSFFLKLFLI